MKNIPYIWHPAWNCHMKIFDQWFSADENNKKKNQKKISSAEKNVLCTLNLHQSSASHTKHRSACKNSTKRKNTCSMLCYERNHAKLNLQMHERWWLKNNCRYEWMSLISIHRKCCHLHVIMFVWEQKKSGRHFVSSISNAFLPLCVSTHCQLIRGWWKFKWLFYKSILSNTNETIGFGRRHESMNEKTHNE